MAQILILALLPLMLVIAVTTDGDLRAWLELAGFCLLFGLLAWRQKQIPQRAKTDRKPQRHPK